MGMVGYGIGGATLRLGSGNTLTLPWAVIVPVMSAVVIGTTVHTPVSVLEDGTSRHLPALRAAHLATLLALSMVVSGPASIALTGAITAPAALRNLLGFAGLALIAAYAVGSSYAWCLPLAVALSAVIAGTSQDGGIRLWAWPIQTNYDLRAWLIALGLLAIGSLLIIVRGSATRQT